MRRLFLSLFLIIPAITVHAEDWPQFRGPTGQGISNSTSVPIEWDTKKNVAWKTRIPGRGWSSPVRMGERIYLTSATGEEKGGSFSLRAICVDANSGKVLWDTELFRSGPGPSVAMHSKNSQASPTPVVAGDRMYAHFGHL